MNMKSFVLGQCYRSSFHSEAISSKNILNMMHLAILCQKLWQLFLEAGLQSII
jgi:hypothetical protein